MAKIISESDISRRDISTIQNLVNALANERVASVLPKDPANYTKYRNMSFSDIALDLAWGTVERRSVDWIVKNGKCLDGHFHVQKSTIPKAGLGTFALRKIKEGEMIAPATLVHIADKESLNILNRTLDPSNGNVVKFGEDPKTESEEPVGKQMLMNYCFGHRDSSVVLCPTITVAAMNHCSNRTQWGGQCTKSGANAGYRWPQDWSLETKEWLQLSYEELKKVSDYFLNLLQLTSFPLFLSQFHHVASSTHTFPPGKMLIPTEDRKRACARNYCDSRH